MRYVLLARNTPLGTKTGQREIHWIIGLNLVETFIVYYVDILDFPPEKRVGVLRSTAYRYFSIVRHAWICTLYIYKYIRFLVEFNTPSLHPTHLNMCACMGISVSAWPKKMRKKKKANAKLRGNDLKMMNYNGIVMTTKFIRNGWQERKKWPHNCPGTISRMKFIKSHLNWNIHWMPTHFISIGAEMVGDPLNHNGKKFSSQFQLKDEVQTVIPTFFRRRFWVSDAAKLDCGYPPKSYDLSSTLIWPILPLILNRYQRQN